VPQQQELQELPSGLAERMEVGGSQRRDENRYPTMTLSSTIHNPNPAQHQSCHLPDFRQLRDRVKHHLNGAKQLQCSQMSATQPILPILTIPSLICRRATSTGRSSTHPRLSWVPTCHKILGPELKASYDQSLHASRLAWVWSEPADAIDSEA